MKKYGKIFAMITAVCLIGIIGFCVETYAEDKKVEVSQRATVERNVYSLYNINSGEHFYTVRPDERDNLVRCGWKNEGAGWTAPTTGKPVYRLFDFNSGQHHYTLNAAERDALKRNGWRYEGIAFYSGGSVPIYRSYNPDTALKAGAHNFTVQKNENDYLLKVGWRSEGIGWYGLKETDIRQTKQKHTWFAFGDSITAMGYYIDTVSHNTGLQCVKYGYSGYAFGDDPLGFGSLRNAVNKMLASDVNPEVITIFGGTNDFGHGDTVEKMKRGLSEILIRIIRRWPKAKLLVITPLQRNVDTVRNPRDAAGNGPNQVGRYLINYADGIKQEAKRYHVPVLDLYHESGITMSNARKYTLDGLHPTRSEGKILGEKIAQAIKISAATAY